MDKKPISTITPEQAARLANECIDRKYANHIGSLLYRDELLEACKTLLFCIESPSSDLAAKCQPAIIAARAAIAKATGA